MSFFLLVLFLQLSHNGWLLPPCSAKIAPFDIASDAYSLLAFRDHFLLTTNLSNILRTNWTSASNATTSSVVCHWIGVTCGARHQRVVALDLGDMGLAGTIPSHFGNLSFLRVLNISSNKFHGQLPKEMAGLHRLSSIDVSFNSLSGNIPAWFGLLPQLKYLDIHNNSFTGPIPPFLSNASKLKILDISSNLVNGMIPVELGNLHNLQHLKMSFNQLTGEIPRSIFNLTLLEKFSLYSNGISGGLPEDMCTSLPKLRLLDLAYNELEGHIQSSLQFCARLEKLSLAYNKFHGPLTGALENLTMLNLLYLTGNDLKGLATGENVSSKSTPSIWVYPWATRRALFVGRIPEDIGNISNLAYIDLSQNHMVGTLPNTFQSLSNLQQFSVFGNHLRGLVPNGLCYLRRLGYLDLGENEFISPLPNCLGNMSYSLRYLYLGANKFSSNIPPSLWTLKDLLTLDLSSNSFTGHLPPGVGNLRAAGTINLSTNQLFGPIPTAISSLLTLVNLSLAHNSFNGSIPESFGKLVSIEYLDLSGNNLSGTIPRTLESLSHLKYLNLSFNQLSGEIPSGGQFQNLTDFSFQPNKALCGSPRFKVQKCQKRSDSSKHLTKIKKVLILVAVTFVTLLGLASLYLWLKHRKTNHIRSSEDSEPAMAHERISYHELLQATNSFDESNLLGKGSFGSVYKGVFANGRTLAVKVFHLQVERAIRSFDTECEVLRNIRHRNLTKVISSCTNLDFKALILEYMPNGNLDRWLYSHNYILDVKKRLDIMIDVASALDYLHHGYSVPIVHCDLKPSNVLLDEDMVAHVSDFGISKILSKEGSMEQTNTLATIGYAAPEYGREGLVSMKCDVYSFGIMLMEVFTRRRPTDEMFNGDLDLKRWVKASLPDHVIEVIDENLVNQEEDEFKGDKNHAVVQCVSIILELACNCSADSSGERVNMKDVLKSLRKAKVQLLADLT